MSGSHWPNSQPVMLSTIQLEGPHFFANTGYHPRMSFGPPRLAPRAVSKDLAERSNEGNDFATKMQEITDLLKEDPLVSHVSFQIY